MTTPDPVKAIADAVLYEGYILWPYRRSAMKNRRRFTFGGVFPPAHTGAHPDDPCRMQTQVLLEGTEDARIAVRVRFLHVVRRQVNRVGADGTLIPVDELSVEGERYLSWEEAAEREIALPPRTVGELREGHIARIDFAGGEEREPVGTDAVILRSWQGLRGRMDVRGEPVAGGLARITVEIVNETPFAGTREQALEQTFCSTHTILRATGGSFVSQADPPGHLAEAAASCENVGTWPVPVGEPDDRTTVLSSPIILEDHPRIAPESPGDLFDGGEIDGLLVLNILTLTDEEKAEMAASDPRAREVLERTEALTPEQLMALHGTIREYGMAR